MKDQDQTKQRVISLTNQQLQKGGQGGDSDKNTFVDRIVEGFRYTYFVMYTRSFEQELFNNSKILAVVLLLLKQLQILSLLFIPQFESIWPKNDYTNAIRKALGVINPALPIQELSGTDIKRARVPGSMIFFGFLVFPLIKNFLIRKNSKRGSLVSSSANKIIILLHMAFTELMPIPFILILLMDAQCRASPVEISDTSGQSNSQKHKNNFAVSCAQPGYLTGGVISFLDGLEISLFIFLVYRLKQINFDQRIKNRSFGAKRSNHSESLSFLIKSAGLVMLYSFTAENENMTCIIFAVAILSSFAIKANSGDFICHICYKIHLAVESLSFWITIDLIYIRVIKKKYQDLTLVFLLCSVIMFIMILLSRKNTALDLIKHLDKNSLHTPLMWIKSLQMITWLQNERKLRRGGVAKKIFEGFYQVYIGINNRRKRHFADDLQQNFMKGEHEEAANLINDENQQMGFLPRSYSSLYGHQTIAQRDFAMDLKIADYMIEKYLKAMRRFPKSTDLKISFLYYLADFTGHTTMALYNIQLLETQYMLSWKQRAQLFRLKGILDDLQMSRNRDYSRSRNRIGNSTSQMGLGDGQNGGVGVSTGPGEGFVSQIIAQKLNSLFNSLLEKASNQYVLLWQTLSDDSPKIQKVNKLLHKSWEAIENVETSWNKNKVFKDHNLVAKEIMGSFCRGCSISNRREEES